MELESLLMISSQALGCAGVDCVSLVALVCLTKVGLDEELSGTAQLHKIANNSNNPKYGKFLFRTIIISSYIKSTK